MRDKVVLRNKIEYYWLELVFFLICAFMDTYLQRFGMNSGFNTRTGGIYFL